jgi:16S rRNA processing protein RimM
MNPNQRNLIAVARLTGIFGIRGELKCSPSSAGEGALAAQRPCFLDPQGVRSVTPVSVRRGKKGLLLTLRDVNDIEAARPFVGATLYLPREQLRLTEDEFLDDDLIGMRVRDSQGRELGTVSGVAHYPAQPCLIVEPGATLLPMVRAFIQAVDLTDRLIVATPPDGLFDPSKAEKA